MRGEIELLRHPESPGERIPVRRGFLGKLLKPREFATPAEVSKYYEARELVGVYHMRPDDKGDPRLKEKTDECD